jgi:hypothetical protein
MVFIFFVPGLTLSLAGDVQLLPANIVRFLYPYSILPWEKAFVTAVHAGQVTVTNLINPSTLNEQPVVVAFVSFFLVFLIIGLQTRADAIFADQSLRSLPVALLGLPAFMLLRSYSLYMLFEPAGGRCFAATRPLEFVSEARFCGAAADPLDSGAGGAHYLYLYGCDIYPCHRKNCISVSRWAIRFPRGRQ